jgi:hypothetical protein
MLAQLYTGELFFANYLYLIYGLAQDWHKEAIIVWFIA